MSLAIQIGDENVEQSIAIDIAHVGAHAGKGLSIIPDSDTCQ